MSYSDSESEYEHFIHLENVREEHKLFKKLLIKLCKKFENEGLPRDVYSWWLNEKRKKEESKELKKFRDKLLKQSIKDEK